MTLVSISTSAEPSVQQLIDQTLIDFFDTSIQRARAVDPYYEDIWKNLAALHASGGKRIRPKIVLMSYTAFGGQDISAIIPIACAQELLHFSMLIHDDIIDRDLTRYGVDNMSGRYEKLYSPFVSDLPNRSHYANSAAIMAGDLMIAAAHKLVNDSTVASELKITASNIMYDSIFDVVGGELLDTESSFRPIGSIDPLKIAHFKTASYSFVGPFLTGASLAGANHQKQSVLRDLAVHLGIAYQLTDDVLGVFGDEKKTGKSASGDIREGKQTLLINTTIAGLSADEKSIFTRCFGKHDANADQVETIRQLIVSSGAKKAVEQAIDVYVEQAKESLRSLHLDESSYAQIENLIHTATKRDL